MKTTVRVIHLILKAGLGAAAIIGVPAMLQEDFTIHSMQSRKIDDIRLRLLEHDSLADQSSAPARDNQAEEQAGHWYDFPRLPSWSTWSNWGNGWGNY